MNTSNTTTVISQANVRVGDLLNWLMMPLSSAGRKSKSGVAYGRDTHHLEGVVLDGSPAEPAYSALTPNHLIFMKGAKGSPSDIDTYDAGNIYDWITELGKWNGIDTWSDPSAFKMFTPAVPMWSRQAGLLPASCGGLPISAFTAQQGGKSLIPVASAPPTVGRTSYILAGPYPIDHGGDFGTLATLVLSYFWDFGAVREEFYLTQEFGRCRWTSAEEVAGEYVISHASIHNKLVAGGAPKLSFPAFPIT